MLLASLPQTTDPLVLLPTEIVLRILDFVPIDGLAALTRLTKAWHIFIDENHQDAIYSSSSKTPHDPTVKDPAHHADHSKSFARYFDGIQSWKELCKMQTSLHRNMTQERPITTESVIQVGSDPVWRFRPDFRRRIILSTSQQGGLNVTCMDTGRRLWALEKGDVRPYAHLEYSEIGGRGVAVFDRWGNAVEVWRTVEDANEREDSGPHTRRRGIFEQIAILNHDCETRGYQLSYGTLCVVSTQGRGFVYDMSVCAGQGLISHPPLTANFEIESEAVGHLDQNEDCVMYSIGRKGYHVHSKATGAFLGAIEPWKCAENNIYHINHPRSERSEASFADLTMPRSTRLSRHGPTSQTWPPQDPSWARLVPMKVGKGPAITTPPRMAGARSTIEEDDWGAGMLAGDVMVGLSRGGRVVVVRKWRDCLARADNNSAATAANAMKLNASLVLCQPHEYPSDFDMGGWLSFRDERILFETSECIYVLSLDSILPTDGGVQARYRPSFACSTSSVSELTVPVSFMALFDDCFMFTYTTLGGVQPGDEDEEHGYGRGRFPTKAIKVVSFSPQHEGDTEVVADATAK